MTGPELKAARIAKGLSRSYISARLRIGPSTLASVERGELSAMHGVLKEWEQIIRTAPAPSRFRWLKANPYTVLMVVAFVTAAAFLVYMFKCGR